MPLSLSAHVCRLEPGFVTSRARHGDSVRSTHWDEKGAGRGSGVGGYGRSCHELFLFLWFPWPPCHPRLRTQSSDSGTQSGDPVLPSPPPGGRWGVGTRGGSPHSPAAGCPRPRACLRKACLNGGIIISRNGQASTSGDSCRPVGRVLLLLQRRGCATGDHRSGKHCRVGEQRQGAVWSGAFMVVSAGRNGESG